MPEIEVPKLIKAVKREFLVPRVRNRAHSGGIAVGRLLEFRRAPYEYQIELTESINHIPEGQVSIYAGHILTGIPKLGWVSGDWVAFGHTLTKHALALGTSYGCCEHIATGLKCFWDSATPKDSAIKLMANSHVCAFLNQLVLRPDEVAIFVPDGIAANFYERSVEEIILALHQISELATHFPLAPKNMPVQEII